MVFGYVVIAHQVTSQLDTWWQRAIFGGKLDLASCPYTSCSSSVFTIFRAKLDERRRRQQPKQQLAIEADERPMLTEERFRELGENQDAVVDLVGIPEEEERRAVLVLEGESETGKGEEKQDEKRIAIEKILDACCCCSLKFEDEEN